MVTPPTVFKPDTFLFYPQTDWTNFHFQLNDSRQRLFVSGSMPTVQLQRETFS